ncbi:MAG TPA: lipocalin-like domain-containing protein [Acidobacteriota bacterium]|nr:lipocalin-like domain-containing protein [Acidobacteriota bacterium]
MRTTLETAGSVLMLSILLSVSAVAQQKLEGAWKVTEFRMYYDFGKTLAFAGNQPGMVLFTKTRFSMVTVVGDKPRPDLDRATATDAQKVAAWMPFIALAGTYERMGTRLIFHDDVSKDPFDMKPGFFYSIEYELQTDTLVLSVKANQDGPIPNPMVIKLSRLD